MLCVHLSEREWRESVRHGATRIHVTSPNAASAKTQMDARGHPRPLALRRHPTTHLILRRRHHLLVRNRASGSRVCIHAVVRILCTRAFARQDAEDHRMDTQRAD